MELTLSQLREITLGALDITEEADGFRFSRMTAAQAVVFTAMNETFGPKCHTNSGVRLDFETDSAFLEIRWGKPVFAASTFCFFDVFVDGVLALHSGTYDCEAESRGDFYLALPEGVHRVQVFLPTKAGVCLASVKLSDGAQVVPCRPDRRILVHGDSITQGYDAVFPSGCYANILARHYNAEILNQAVGGANYNPRVLESVGEFDFAVAAYGTNDWTKKTPETFGPDADAFFAKLKELYPDMPVYVILPIWRADDKSRPEAVGDFREARALLGALAKKQGFTVLDDYEMVPHDTELFSDKRLHPNDDGFVFYANRLIELLGENP